MPPRGGFMTPKEVIFMATIGNLASVQLNMAKAQEKFSQLSTSNLFNTSSVSSTSSTSASDAMSKILQDKYGYIQEEYTKLYNKVYGKEEAETASDTVSLKSAANTAKSAANDITDFANRLEYGGEYNSDDAAKALQSFVDGYNSLVDKAGDSESKSVLQKGVILVNSAKVNKGSLSRVGISLGSDNKMTFDKDKLAEDVTATDIKSTFSTGGIASQVAQKAQQIAALAGSTGGTTYSASSTPSYNYTIGTLMSTYA